MSFNTRKEAVLAASRRPCEDIPRENREAKIVEIFGEDVFSFNVMKDYLPKSSYRILMQTVNERAPLDAVVADDVANAMKQWAISKGASHYTHWFLPLTGSTAEKHDAFVEPDGDSGVIMNFSGKNLIVGEPDASSFPSGGLRSTFEARGYTAWDPTSPAFIKRGKNSATLCIPTAFCSYTGEALDKKTPLLRSIQAISKQITRILKCFKMDNAGAPEVTLGAEQEYFLIDKCFYLCRPDLIHTGRTLFGALPAKHQQLDDHYFGSIKPRILRFMSEVDQALWRLGIPAKTRHNEAAPAQFEIASVFEEVNLAIDHNMLTMEVLQQIADRHGFVCLLHEKPFQGINGSGKHNNWSFGAGRLNMLNPGKDPRENALFLTALCAVIQAVDRHGDLLRAITASAGNDFRLGASEAPPAIISIYLGEQLTDVIESLETKQPGKGKNKRGLLKIGVDALPPLPQDATDRNRTSPFAYTGNKFEFRMPGSSQSCASANIVLNTITAESLDEIATEIEQFAPEQFNEKLQELLHSIVIKHKRIIFNGDNYAEEWTHEAERRGLPNLRTTPEALQVLNEDKNIKLFEKYQVLSPVELRSRFEVFMEDYNMRSIISGKVALSMARTVIYPAISRQLAEMAGNIGRLQSCGMKIVSLDLQEQVFRQVDEHLAGFMAAMNQLESALGQNNVKEVIAIMRELRKHSDVLEQITDDSRWPIPKYSEMLFIY